MTAPLVIVVRGIPAPQGSKRHVGKGVMVESSRAVKPWRDDVRAAALDVIRDDPTYPLDGPIAVEMTFTVRPKPVSRPTWWPTGVRWSRSLWWRPASTPDLSKLVRSTEDALTSAGVWRDDARVVEYRRLAKTYADDPYDANALPVPGAVIRVWQLPAVTQVFR